MYISSMRSGKPDRRLLCSERWGVISGPPPKSNHSGDSKVFSPRMWIFLLVYRGVSAIIRCCCCRYYDIVIIIVITRTMVVFMLFSARSVTQFLEWHEKCIYQSIHLPDGKLMARQCLFEETLFNKTFDKEINLSDECLTRLASVTALTLAKATIINHRYV